MVDIPHHLIEAEHKLHDLIDGFPSMRKDFLRKRTLLLAGILLSSTVGLIFRDNLHQVYNAAGVLLGFTDSTSAQIDKHNLEAAESIFEPNLEPELEHFMVEPTPIATSELIIPHLSGLKEGKSKTTLFMLNSIINTLDNFPTEDNNVLTQVVENTKNKIESDNMIIINLAITNNEHPADRLGKVREVRQIIIDSNGIQTIRYDDNIYLHEIVSRNEENLVFSAKKFELSKLSYAEEGMPADLGNYMYTLSGLDGDINLYISQENYNDIFAPLFGGSFNLDSLNTDLTPAIENLAFQSKNDFTPNLGIWAAGDYPSNLFRSTVLLTVLDALFESDDFKTSLLANAVFEKDDLSKNSRTIRIKETAPALNQDWFEPYHQAVLEGLNN